MPDGRISVSSPWSSAVNSEAKSTTSPSTLTSTPRSNQSLAARRRSSLSWTAREMERVLGGLAQHRLVADHLDVTSRVRLQPRHDLAQQRDRVGPGERGVPWPAVDADERGQQVGGQLERIHGGGLGGPVPSLAAGTAQARGGSSAPLAGSGRTSAAWRRRARCAR